MNSLNRYPTSEYKQVIAKDIKKVINILYKELFGKGFEDFYDPSCGSFIVDLGGKDCKKTWTYIGLISILHILEYKYNNVVITRKEKSMHRNTTMAVFENAMKLIEEITGFNYRPLFVVKVATHIIEYIPTGQKIFYESFNITDTNRDAVIPTVGVITLVIHDETLERSEGDQTKKTMQKWISTAYQIWNSNTRGEYAKYGLNKAKNVKIVLIGNPWSEVNYLVEEFMEPWMQESQEILEKYGKQVFNNEDYSYKGLKGARIIFRNLLLNEFMTDEEKIDAFKLKYTNIDAYRTETLGMRGQLRNGIYIDILQYIKTPQELPNGLCQFVSGVDYGTASDATACFITGITRQTRNQDDSINPSHIITMGGFYNENQYMQKRPDDYDFTQARKIVDFWVDMANKYPIIKQYRLKAYIETYGFKDLIMRELRKRNIEWVSLLTTDGYKQKVKIPERIIATRELAGKSRIHFMKDIDGYNGMATLWHQLTRAKKNDQGKRIDKDFHAGDGWEYSWIFDLPI